MKEKQAKSTHGGARPGAGRKKGSINKATADIRAAAQEYTDQALDVLFQIATAGESEAARVAAANSILDRGHGKPRQMVEVEADVKTTVTRIELVGPDGSVG